MKKEAFQLLHDMENSWWYRARARVARRVLGKFLGNKTNEKILDWGSGYGGMFKVLHTFGSVSGFEIDEGGKSMCQSRCYKRIFSTPNEALSAENFTLTALFDVMEHVENDKELSNLLYQNLSPGGHIIITVPAYNWLWSVHDVEHQHYRRYSKKTIKELLVNAGFKVNYSSYWNMTLFLPAAAMRLLGFSGASSLTMSSLLNKIFYAITSIESSLIPFISLPFGTGIVIIAQKNKSAQ